MYFPFGPRNLSGLKSSGSGKFSGSIMIEDMFTTNQEPVGNVNPPDLVLAVVLCSKVIGATSERR